VYFLRYGVLDWAPTYLKEVKHFSVENSSWAYFAYEWAGIPGTLLCGWISDRLFGGRRAPAGILFMALVTLCVLVYWLNPPGNPGIDIAALIGIGFLVYGPVMLIGLHALELAPKKAAGTAAGFTGLFGYVGGSVAASALLGWTVHSVGWGGGFALLTASCIAAIVLLALTLRHERPTHGGTAAPAA
ncbi:MAG: MFS transporter, partial [Gammaproteobacteria bacterium]